MIFEAIPDMSRVTPPESLNPRILGGNIISQNGPFRLAKSVSLEPASAFEAGVGSIEFHQIIIGVIRATIDDVHPPKQIEFHDLGKGHVFE